MSTDATQHCSESWTRVNINGDQVGAGGVEPPKTETSLIGYWDGTEGRDLCIAEYHSVPKNESGRGPSGAPGGAPTKTVVA